MRKIKILFLGGDKRQLSIIEELKNKYQIETVGYDNITINNTNNKKLSEIKLEDYQVIIFPVSGVLDNGLIETNFSKETIMLTEDLLLNTKKDVLIFSGVKSKALKKMLALANKEAIIMMNDQEVTKENSVPTIEGIISDLIIHTDYTINQAKVLVLGYGNVGQPLVEILIALGAKVTVGTKVSRNNELLKAKNINFIFTNDYQKMKETLETCDIIINTVPSLILDKKYLEVVNKQAYLLDIASFPYGIDFNYAELLKLDYKKLLGIPGLIAPKTAGLILAKKIKKVLGGDYNN